MKLFLVRHGETQAGSNGAYGYSASLNDLGRSQAERTGRFMLDLGVTRIVSSDAARALETAEPLKRALGMQVDVIPELTEIDIGKPSDGVTPMQENRTPDGRFIMDCAHLGGESWDQFRDRVSVGLGILDDRYVSDEVVAVFTHGGVKNVAVDRYLGRDASRTMHTLFDNGSISTIEAIETGHILHGVNEVSHLR